MSDPFDEKFTAQNPIVAAASRIRARREIDKALDVPGSAAYEDAQTSFAAFGKGLQVGIKRLNAILGERTGVKFIHLMRPERLRLRFQDKRIALDLDEVHQLVRVTGSDLDGEYQFAPVEGPPSLINVSKVSTETGYGDALTPSALLRLLAQDAEIEPPEHLQGPGPLQF